MQEYADAVTFTEEILNKLYFLWTEVHGISVKIKLKLEKKSTDVASDETFSVISSIEKK